MPAFWDRTDDYSTINLIIKEAREHGYLPKLTGNQARDTKALAEALPAVEVAPIDDNESWTEVR
ncbi:hypothetical protein [Fontivita pretiosa]